MVIDLSNKVCGQAKMFTRTDTLNRYFQGIRDYEVFTKEEEAEIFKRLERMKVTSANLGKELSNADTNEKRKMLLDAIKKNNDAIGELKDTIIKHNQRFVISIARKYASNSTIMDLISEGNIGLIEAIETYVPGKGTKFSSWAVYYIRRSINQYRVEVEPQVKQTNRQLTYHVKSAALNKFIQENHREPTCEELADYINNRHPRKVNDSDLLDTVISSVDETYEDGGTMADFSMALATMPNEAKYEENEHNAFIADKLVNRLSDREKEIVKMTFGIGFDREYEASEIAEKVGITTERVRQINKSAMSKMRNLALWNHLI